MQVKPQLALDTYQMDQIVKHKLKSIVLPSKFQKHLLENKMFPIKTVKHLIQHQLLLRSLKTQLKRSKNPKNRSRNLFTVSFVVFFKIWHN